MNVGIIGRSEILYDTAIRLHEEGHVIKYIITAKEAPEYKKKSEDFKSLAKNLNIDFFFGSNIELFKDEIKKYSVDVGVSMNYSGIIPETVTSLFPLGILNAHGGDLPKYRGNACQAWAILNGEDKIGLCIHRMIGGELDNGDIIQRDYYHIDINTKIGDVWVWMQKTVPELFMKSLAGLNLDPNFILQAQSKLESEALRCYPRKPEDGKIIWEKSCEEVLRLINASSEPYQGAFSYLNEKKIIILRAEIDKSNEVFCAIPGQITAIYNDSVNVACGKGKLKISKIKFESKEMNPSDLITSVRMRFCSL